MANSIFTDKQHEDMDTSRPDHNHHVDDWGPEDLAIFYELAEDGEK